MDLTARHTQEFEPIAHHDVIVQEARTARVCQTHVLRESGAEVPTMSDETSPPLDHVHWCFSMRKNRLPFRSKPVTRTSVNRS